MGDLYYAKALSLASDLLGPRFALQLARSIKEVAQKSFDSGPQPLIWAEELARLSLCLGGLLAGLDGEPMKQLQLFGKSFGSFIRAERLGRGQTQILKGEALRLIETIDSDRRRRMLNDLVEAEPYL